MEGVVRDVVLEKEVGSTPRIMLDHLHFALCYKTVTFYENAIKVL